MGYEYDVFISYCHESRSKDWVQEHFFPLLKDKLSDECPEEPRLFIDHQMPNGVYWSQTIQRALVRSKIVLSIWNPQYFRSKWCQAEWQTIMKREAAANVAAHEEGFLYSVVYGDGDFFPEEASARQNSRFHNYARTAPAFRDSHLYLEFEEKVAEVARDVVQRIQNAPDWEDTWEVIHPDNVQLIPSNSATVMPTL